MNWYKEKSHWAATSGTLKAHVFNSASIGGWVYTVDDHSKGRWAPTQGERVAAGGPYQTPENAMRYCARAVRKLSPSSEGTNLAGQETPET